MKIPSWFKFVIVCIAILFMLPIVFKPLIWWYALVLSL